MNNLFRLRAAKLFVSLMHPICWRPILYGVFPTVDHLDVLKSLDVEVILDVGANRGQFSLACRIACPDVPIIAFEPIPSEAAVFRLVHAECANVRLIEKALAQNAGKAVLHVSRRADSSSLLPIGDGQKKIFNGTEEVSTLEVQTERLDAFAGLLDGYSNALLKLDVQGFELEVLKGSERLLDKCAYIYAECSEQELYVGQALYKDVEAFLSCHGFQLAARYNEISFNNKPIQADCLFKRL